MTVMKNVLIISIFSMMSMGLYAQSTKGTINKSLNKTNSNIKKMPVTAPPPKVNNATESNRKRPGGTLPNNSNSKQAPPAGDTKKKSGKLN